ncbi:beta-ketoacyl synthase N-terminal-like domain-containing protein [Robiginitalea aestuariiviva]|uniref:beta-ketoacyl synthase N-terminal-like domain-containing protein n=1 Tax=Robiginitalea aestuariiviva TaxID=3036903 RepID=UPI0030C767ED
MLANPVSITGMASLSALGSNRNAVWDAYGTQTHALTQHDFGSQQVWAGALPQPEKTRLEALAQSHLPYRRLDPTALMAIAVSRRAVQEAGWGADTRFGVNFGSSRGATSLTEEFLTDMQEGRRLSSLASPHTTLGNISSWVAQDLGASGPDLSHSITCSTALHAVLNGVAWLHSGLASRFLVGGSEAPLTPFTLAQMQALKIYSSRGGDYPCRALDLEKEDNTMVLGEGAVALCLEPGNRPGSLAQIHGIGYATEALAHPASLSAEARCLQRSMHMALEGVSPQEVGVVVMHAPGTLQGDRAELEAVRAVFGNRMPAITSNKWKIGHTLGASGLLSLELAVGMLRHKQVIGTPFTHPGELEGRYALINAVGFGGNAVSLLIGHP